jgi:hypothetical protein
VSDYDIERLGTAQHPEAASHPRTAHPRTRELPGTR